MNDLNVNLHPDAFALRLCRSLEDKNEFRYYQAVTFPNNPRSGCELYLRRCMAFGYLTNPENTPLIVDILDEEGLVIQDFGITPEGFEYLRKTLKFRVDQSVTE